MTLLAPATSLAVLTYTTASTQLARRPDDVVLAYAGTTALSAGVQPTEMDALLGGTLHAIFLPTFVYAHSAATTLQTATRLPPMGAQAITATLSASRALVSVNADVDAVRFHLHNS